ncbi:MAG: transporter [Bacillota bacterium]|nr:transporter [Bacillota bacterium]
MKKNFTLIFQISAVFIGTIVGAGLASGQEITQFFTTFGYKSFIGLIICMLLYIIIGFMIINISMEYKLNSYKQLINLVSPGLLGEIIDIIMGFFMISSAGIILAGSGALLHQYFGCSKWVGIILMIFISLFALLRNTKGLIEINSFIVPSLLIVIVTIFALYMMLSKDHINIAFIKSIPYTKNHWQFSSILYAGFNILCCSGVLVPLSNETQQKKPLQLGLLLGAVCLTLLSFMLNLMLMLNIPYIFEYEVPLLYIANRFGNLIQISLLCIIFLEMFSTEVSDIYSLGKTVEQAINVPYKVSVIIILCVAIPISQIGFKNLITFLYPAFGLISTIFMIQCCIFYKKNKL